ncbi:YggT family protein [Pullulanibacillus sp. KACC 23026]|uniref:YggT family protein n=1 Tax=Pullulanibacillus sp. KACC 23026 TaxID=3028315 RepID=UPI0023B0A5C1|nr:YggT family protein [Pullulanibacillus sp. KACC 23026]WEG13795.1 YggT family protein [Pullulanibacillus sp. KACC 23026]
MKRGAHILIKLINGIVSIIQLLIGLGLVLKFFGARPVPFVRFMYALEAPLLAPFNGIFLPINFSPQYVLDMSALFALIVYSVIGYTLIKLIEIAIFK